MHQAAAAALDYLDVETDTGGVGDTVDGVEAGDDRCGLGGTPGSEVKQELIASGLEIVIVAEDGEGETDQDESTGSAASRSA